jgi:hypothetical protein
VAAALDLVVTKMDATDRRNAAQFAELREGQAELRAGLSDVQKTQADMLKAQADMLKVQASMLQEQTELRKGQGVLMENHLELKREINSVRLEMREGLGAIMAHLGIRPKA